MPLLHVKGISFIRLRQAGDGRRVACHPASIKIYRREEQTFQTNRASHEVSSSTVADIRPRTFFLFEDPLPILSLIMAQLTQKTIKALAMILF